MRFLFRELFKRLRIRYIILILVLSIPISYVFQYVVNVTLISKNEFPLEKSPNPQATEHFIKAMEYRNYISHIHNFIDYDNFLMRPLFNKMNEEYEKGKSLLPKTSAEDVYWYVILYRGIYGIGGIPDDYDMSMAYKTTLTKEDYKKHYEDIVNKIKRFAINDFNYDVPRITNYKFEFMSNLLTEYDVAISLIRKLENNFFGSGEYTKDFNQIYIYYTQFRDKYLPLANKQDKNNLVALHDEILFFLQFTTYIEYLQTNQIYCNYQKYILLLTKMKEIKNSKTKEEKSLDNYLSNVFEKSSWLYKLTIALEKCPNLEKEAKEVLGYFHPKIKQRYEEYLIKNKWKE